MPQTMAHVRRLPTREEVRRRKVANALIAEQRAIPFEDMELLSPQVKYASQQLVRALSRDSRDQDASLWPGGYDMFSRRQMEYVRKELRKLGRHDRRQDVYDAFLLLIGNIERDTGEITLSRKEFADELGILPRNLSSVMGTLERIGVVRREREGRMVTYYVNANVAWNGDLDLRKVEAAKAPVASEKSADGEAPMPPGPLLVLMQGGLAEQPAQAGQVVPEPPGAGARKRPSKVGMVKKVRPKAED
jgi:DNA-binding transcriptional ArsR family regulator